MEATKQNVFQRPLTMTLLALACTALWGSAATFIKLGYAAMNIVEQDSASQLLFAGCRFTTSGLMTLAVLGIFRRKLPLPKKNGAVKRVAALALTQTFFQYICFYIGVAHTTGTNTAIINGCNAFITILASALIFRSEKLNLYKTVGCALGIFAVVLMNLSGLSEGIRFTLAGEGLLFGAMFSGVLSTNFIKRFSRDKEQSPLIVEAYKSIGDCWRKLGKEKQALRAFEDATREYAQRELDATAPQASEAAGEARFLLAEAEFAKWDAMQITGRSKALERSFMAKLTAAKSLQESYVDVLRFKSAEWILAASYRRGFIYERFAVSLVESPCPPDIKRAYGEEGCEMYRATLVDKVSGLENSAADLYEQTSEQCRRFALVDVPWCDRAEESLARLRSDRAVLKKARALTRSNVLYPTSFRTLDGKPNPIVPAVASHPAVMESTPESASAPAQETSGVSQSAEGDFRLEDDVAQPAQTPSENADGAQGTQSEGEGQAVTPPVDADGATPREAGARLDDEVPDAAPATTSDSQGQGGFRIEEDF